MAASLHARVSFDVSAPLSHSSLTQSLEQFACGCGTKYWLARIEAFSEPAAPIACISCGSPLSGRNGVFFLKYFLTERPKGRRTSQSPHHESGQRNEHRRDH
jgi:hypothetical protein